MDQDVIVELDGSESKGKHDTKLFNRIGFILTIMLVLVQLCETLFYLLVNRIDPELWKMPWMSWLMIVVGFYITAFPAYCLLMKKIPNAPKGDPKPMNIGRLISLFFIGMAALYILNYLSLMINYSIGSVLGKSINNPLAAVIDSSNLFYTFLFVGIVAPIIEEIIFRGILLDKIRGFGDKTAIWVTAITFGLFHLNTSQVLYAIALGVIFAYIALKTNQIKYSIILHIGINIMGSVIAPALASAGYLSVVGGMVILLTVIGTVLFLILKKRIAAEEVEQPIPKVSKTVVLGNPGMILYISICVILIVTITIF